jgi:IMP dehydrogenase
MLGNALLVGIGFALTRVRQFSEEEFDEPGLCRAWETTGELEDLLDEVR